MSDQTSATRPSRFFRDFLRLAGPWWTGPERVAAWTLTAALLGLGVAQVLLAIRLNLWFASFFNALERRSFDHVMGEVGILGLVILGTMGSNAAHLVVRRRIQIQWRRYLTERIAVSWMSSGRHYQASLLPGNHDNPDGRIAEDIRIATEAAVDLAHSLFYAVLLLISFVGILWSLSGTVEVMGIPIPGHLVLLAIVYATAGTMIAWLLGRPLVGATDTRQTREANFRYGLVRAREDGEAIALARGETAESGRILRLFEELRPAWSDQSRGLGRLLFFSSGYGTLAPVFPLIVATPRYIAGALTLGQVMQSAQAFQQVTSALSWPVDNLQRIAEWRTSVERVLILEEALAEVQAEVEAPAESSIGIVRTDAGVIRGAGLDVATPEGDAALSGLSFELAAGEAVLVGGDGDASLMLFRVLAGLWPWGRGQIELPPEKDIAAVGERPYFSDGSLRAALAFPAPPTEFDRDMLGVLLDRARLGHLVPRLDEEADWVRGLSAVDAQLLSVTRMLLHRPRWILMGEALNALDAETADAMIGLIRSCLPQTTIVVFGRHPGSPERFERHLSLTRDQSGQVLLHDVRARRDAARRPRKPALRAVDWLRRGYGFTGRG